MFHLQIVCLVRCIPFQIYTHPVVIIYGEVAAGSRVGVALRAASQKKTNRAACENRKRADSVLLAQTVPLTLHKFGKGAVTFRSWLRSTGLRRNTQNSTVHDAVTRNEKRLSTH